MGPELLDKLVRSGSKHCLFEPGAAHSLALGQREIERFIPHRDPFRFVDRVTAIDLAGQAIAGRYHIDPADPVFRGHFPGDPIYPGVLQLEMMGQLGLCLFGFIGQGQSADVPRDRPRPSRALKIYHAAFLAAVRPDDELLVLAKVIDVNDYTGICAGQILNGETICSFAVMEVYFVQD
jgi:3-hydroxyacyl-[acyl-carrier-protein] dehydratase